MKRRKALAVFAKTMFSAILIGALTGGSDSAPQEMNISEPVVTESAVTEETSETETSAYQEEENSPYIIVDEERKTLYYFYKNKETIDLSVIGDIEGIEGIKIAPVEDWYELGGMIGFEKMNNIDNITRLHISGGVYEDLSFLNYFVDLKGLSFKSAVITDSVSECDLSNVRSFGLTDCEAENLNFIKKAELTDFDLESSSVKDTSALGIMQDVYYLSIKDCEIDNIDFIGNMPKLRNAYFENTDIEKIPQLNIIADPEEIEDFLYLYFKNCGTIDISGVSGLADYENVVYRLDFSGSVIKDFSPLKGIWVHELFLNNTAGNDYSTMKGLTASTIWLDNCDLSDIRFLSFNEVGTLFLNGNNISDWSPLLDVEGLVWCWTFDNPVITPDNIEEFNERGIILADSNKWAYPY